MKARVEQVEREKAERSREIDTERQKHKQDEAIQHFKALLSDMVSCNFLFVASFLSLVASPLIASAFPKTINPLVSEAVQRDTVRA